MVLSQNMFCWKNSLAAYIFPTQQKSIMLCDVDVSCICTHGRCHVMLTSLAPTHMVGAARCWPNVLSSAAWPAVSPEIGLPAKPLRRKSVPNLGRAWGEPSLLPFGCKLVCLQLGQIRVASTAIRHHLLHSHRLRSRPDQSKIQTPNGPFGFWILEFGFWILDFGSWILEFGVWILEFGFWILDQFSLRSFCGGPKRRRLEFGFWILVWMRPQPTSFGSCIRYFHVTPTRVGGFSGSFPSGWIPVKLGGYLAHLGGILGNQTEKFL